MGKNLAIRGHATRGKEVIELLEMMGGNTFNSCMKIAYSNRVYYIGNNNAITWDYIGPEEIDKYGIFTLEEFLEKYPFKVGDKAVYEDDNDIVVITKIKWDDTVGDIFYNVKRINGDDCFLCPPELLKPYKETNMNKKLAIRGHPTRGKEVIELLEMMGGYKDSLLKDEDIYDDNYFYFILAEENNAIDGYLLKYKDKVDEDYVIFTLEEFLEKYPFKVGDKVVYTKYGDNCDDYPVIIESMKWTGTTIEYTFDDCVTCLAKDLKMWNCEPDAVISGIYLNSCDYADEVELNLGDYEIVVRDGRTFAVKKKPKYPTTYGECCELLVGRKPNPNEISFDKMELCLVDLDNTQNIDFQNPYLYQLNILFRLRMCRDAYWKIAGEEMGLGKPWKPDWSTSEPKYVIARTCNGTEKQWETTYCKTFAFPTEEMRDAFYENFNDLIEECKELL